MTRTEENDMSSVFEKSKFLGQQRISKWKAGSERVIGQFFFKELCCNSRIRSRIGISWKSRIKICSFVLQNMNYFPHQEDTAALLIRTRKMPFQNTQKHRYWIFSRHLSITSRILSHLLLYSVGILPNGHECKYCICASMAFSIFTSYFSRIIMHKLHNV